MIKFIKRLWRFDDQDWKHLGWLSGNMVKQLFKGDWIEAKDAYYFIRFHLLYDSKRIKEADKDDVSNV